MKHLYLIILFLFVGFNVLSTTAQSVKKIAALATDSVSFNRSSSVVFDDRLFFFESNDKHKKLWVTDGTAEGTTMLLEATPGNDSQENLCIAGSRLFISIGNQLWSATQGGNGLQLIKEKLNIIGSIVPYEYKVYFKVSTDTTLEIWSADSLANTYLHKSTNPHKTNIFVHQEKLFYSTFQQDSCTIVYYNYKDSSERTVMNLGFSSNSILQFVANYHDQLFFTISSATRTNERDIWTTNGTKEGTSFFQKGSIINNFLSTDSLLYFASTGASSVYYASDGTIEGTKIIKTTEDNATAFFYLTPYKNKVYSAGPGNYIGLWETDGSMEGTVQIENVEQPEIFKVFNDKLYLKAGDTSKTLMFYDASEGYLKLIPHPATSNKYPLAITENLMEYKDELYFFAQYESKGLELWKISDASVGVSAPIVSSQLNFFPNPATDRIFIARTGIQKIVISNLLGEIIHAQENVNEAGEVGVSQLEQGVYTIALYNSNGTYYCHKLVKK